jgi:hypothetical protein
MFVPRERLLQVIIGERVLAQGAGKGAGREESRRRVERQTARPPNGRSDAGTGRQERRATDDRAARARRLENMDL